MPNEPIQEHVENQKLSAKRSIGSQLDFAEKDDFELQLLKQAIVRTEAIVRDESANLKLGKVMDLHEFSSRKSHQLLALNRAFEAVSDASQKERLTKELDVLRAALEENASLLRVRLGAVQEVADIIASIMRDAESDGTYSMPMPAGGMK